MSDPFLLAPLLGLAAFIATIWLHVKVLHKAGRSGWWMLAAILFPPLYFLGLWLFAFSRWPALDEPPENGGEGKGQDPADASFTGEQASWPYHSDRRR